MQAPPSGIIPGPRWTRRFARAGLLLGLALLAPGEPQAQLGMGSDMAPVYERQSVRQSTPGTPDTPATPQLGAAAPGTRPAADSNAPITFTADAVEYDRESGVVTARGNVEAWQGERLLRADELTYNRNTDVATARGNVQLMEADGQVLFADEAELKDKFKDGVLTGVRALLAANGRMVANGVRRTNGTVNELSRVIYSSCDLCATDPSKPPLWQVRATTAIQNKETMRVSYRDATVQMGGVPVLYFPYLSHADPSAPRASGFLFPELGMTRFLGGFMELPYFWAIDASSDLLLTTIFSTRQYPNLGGLYRKAFNNGDLQVSASVGGFNGTDTEKKDVAGHIYAKGRFTLDDNWRFGFDLNRATSDLYLRTFRYEYRRVLTSQVYTEGFWGTEAYARIEARAYQGLAATDDNRRQPIVLPNAVYEYAPLQQVAGGWMTMDANTLGIYRAIGSSSLRLASSVGWQRSEFGDHGDLWTFRLLGTGRGYTATGQENAPGYNPVANGEHAFGNLRAAAEWRMPFVRYAGDWGIQTIEPRAQIVTGPNAGRQTAAPNEDSVDLEFTDANLFALNRFPGRDRQEGGNRLDVALRGAWDFPNGSRIEAVGGRSFRDGDTGVFPVGSGLERRESDYVTRLTVSPVSWFDVSGRARLNGENGNVRMFDTTGRVTAGAVTFSAGYLYTAPSPFIYPYDHPRSEVTAGISGRYENWRAGVHGRYNVEYDKPSIATAFAGYEDECFILEFRALRRFVRDINTNQDQTVGNTVLLVRLTLKTLGDFYFRAL